MKKSSGLKISKNIAHVSEVSSWPEGTIVVSTQKGRKDFFADAFEASKAKNFSIRDVTSETNATTPGNTEAKSSFEALLFSDIPPELIRRIARRYTGGHKKYGVGVTNLNWRIGLDDPKYIADRFNHLWEHLLNFMEDLNDKDDNLGAIAWSVGFLMEAERHAPEAFRSVFGHCKLFGETAKKFRDELVERLKK